MKVCTITCHDVYNHGAAMQAYALMKYLKNNGYEVEIIDYKPDYLSNHYKLFSINNEKWDKSILRRFIYLSFKITLRLISLKRKKSFDKFKEENLVITKKRYYSNEELKKDIPKADVYICGSDQIWNSLHMNGRDLAFYLDFVPNNKVKFSYAASFATDDIDRKYKTMVKNAISKLDGVGIREKSGVELVKRLGINSAVNVVDPVFLLEKEDWDKIATEKFKEKYLLVYDFDNSSLIEKIAVEVASKNGLKIYTINTNRPKYADKCFNLSGPKTFVSLVKNAEFVVSNSFHAVVFSIIYQKNIAIVNRNENINTRMRDLLSDLNLEDRLINNNYDIDFIIKDIDYKSVNNILGKKINFSKKFIHLLLETEKR
ncbi:polysaccharide pyruvyl transferase family protein [Clostridium perfringens]|uniref:polysaccharide pyruvyl transferase family protein n=1 Tax=Clostridium perfringens TaxID=1502 RepID=UPI00290AE12F|nr:polysaccharide pyruvyl transferase family protein [Clostridium perfringens]EHR1331030.1 polysaccharide pyruvyl transferase family protein [Clostridium perfringens]EHR1424507.1 polysaccharide pyruvyl transferase family protein [Clostridium perfringens]MDK0742674.1 polysaccharide pyruvyl transferase family protein [Clostridium perfringens]MDK0986986.1 polysaccharide pyruvyl transferase family protein [Clostridium perfringens]